MLLAFAEHASLALTDAQRVSAVEHLAFHDSLTGLVNRAHFMERLNEALIRARLTQSRVGVLFIDLDDFKKVNDSLGHAFGDRLLEVIGRRLAEAVRAYDVAGRLGGDEFAVLMEDGDDEQRVDHVVQRLQSLLSAPVTIDEHTLSVGASVGTTISDGSHDAAEVLRNADLAMYAAKTRRDGRAAAYEVSMHSEAVARLRLEEELRRALAGDEFEVHYQQIVALDCERARGVEALLRWRHPVHGLITPADFISVAEKTGLIVPIGAWVLGVAAHQVAEWRRFHGGDLGLSVNLSARQLLRSEIVEEVAEALRRSGLDPSALVLEITESTILEDSGAVRDRVGALKRLGVRLALDDFGTGYSSLAHLQQLPIDVVKVDRRFVKDLGTDHDGAAMVAAIIGLTDALHLDVVAEGIELPAQAAELRRLGCRLGQGYLFSRPMGAESMSALLRCSAAA
jgi:diguanylate cyclase (GGDEF)-like protein